MLLAMVTLLNLEQLHDKTTFLHDEFEQINMHHPEGLVIQGKDHVCLIKMSL